MCSTELPYLLRSNPSKRTDSSFQPSIKHHPPFLNFSPQTSIFFPFLAQSMTLESPAPLAAGAQMDKHSTVTIQKSMLRILRQVSI
jgi:hypothetical protein